MKTTVELSDSIMMQAKRVAAARGTTLRALIEEGLRVVLAEDPVQRGFQLRRASFSGNGLRPEVEDASWERILKMSYEGRGG